MVIVGALQSPAPMRYRPKYRGFVLCSFPITSSFRWWDMMKEIRPTALTSPSNNAVMWTETRVVYHLHGQTGRFTVWADGNSKFTICTDQFHLPKNCAKAWNLVLKTGFEEMEHEFPFGTFRPGKQYYLFRRSVAPGNFLVKRPDKSCSIYRFQPDFPEPFGNGKHPRC